MPRWTDRLEHRARLRRFAMIRRLLPTIRPLRILDVGGTYAYWQAMGWDHLMPCQITLLNLDTTEVPEPFTSVAGDARDLSSYPDKSFDVVYSNSVIGHVGTFADQQRMAAELQRVGTVVILQTPNHYFPIDWRTLVPCFHWLPASWQAWCFLTMRVGTYAKAPDSETAWNYATRVRNLTHKELRQLFPRGTVHHERIAGFTKSFIVQLHVPTPRP